MTDYFNSGKNGVFNLDHVHRIYWNSERKRFMLQVGQHGFEIDPDRENDLPVALRPDRGATT